jgi:hypothetical protein
VAEIDIEHETDHHRAADGGGRIRLVKRWRTDGRPMRRSFPRVRMKALGPCSTARPLPTQLHDLFARRPGGEVEVVLIEGLDRGKARDTREHLARSRAP